MEYYSSVAKRDGVFTRPRSFATDALGVHFDDVRSAPKADIRFQRRIGRDGPKPEVSGAARRRLFKFKPVDRRSIGHRDSYKLFALYFFTLITNSFQ